MKRKIFFALVAFSSLLPGEEWIHPGFKKVFTVYYQGMNNSQTQGAKYTGQRGFISPTTGEHVVCSKSIDIINQIWVKPEIDEVVPAPTQRDWNSLMLQPKAFLYNIWQRSHEIATGFGNRLSGITVVSRQDSKKLTHTIASHSLAVSQINIAQEGDLASHRARFNSLLAEHLDADTILMGVSRGATTTFIAAARLNKENPSQLKNTKLIQLEGCFDSVEHTMRERHPWLLKHDVCVDALHTVASKVIAHERDGIAPIKVVEDFPKHIPVAFITSLMDKHVPAACTRELVKKLVESGHKEVYLLELKKSCHIGYMCDDAQDAADYQNFSHALYKKLNLPHIPEYAAAGRHLLAVARQNAESLK